MKAPPEQTAIPERQAANAAAEALQRATETRAKLAREATALRDALDQSRADYARLVEAAAAAMASGEKADAPPLLDLRQSEADHAVLTRALLIAAESIAGLRSRAETLERIATQAEAENNRRAAVAELATRGLRVEITNHRSETAHLLVVGNFSCDTLDDAAHLAALVRATGIWPHGEARALDAILKLSKAAKGACHATV